MHNRIFEGITILDLTKVFSGPIATRYFADWGARVVKIEDPTNPDPARGFPPLKNGASGYFELLNRNKESMLLNLKESEDLDKFYELVKSADVVVENMTPSVKKKLKVDYQTLKEINSTMIYASLAGYDQSSNKKCLDVIAQAESGLMSLSGYGEPVKIGPAVIDAYAGMSLAWAISSALFRREKINEGGQVNVSMVGMAMDLLEQNLVEYSIVKKKSTPSRKPGYSPCAFWNL